MPDVMLLPQIASVLSITLDELYGIERKPGEVSVSADDVRDALMIPLKSVFEAIHRVLEQTPPALSADLLESGITLTGGGALLRGLDRFLHEATGLPVHIAVRPLDCVAEGAGKTLEGSAYIPANARRDREEE